MFRFTSGKKIEFLCDPKDRGVVPEPYAAKDYLPEWYRKLVPVDKQQYGINSSGQTIKRCMPFLDAMTTGWIIPLAATARIKVAEGGAKIEYGWDFDGVMVSDHISYQVEGHPLQPRQPLKFHNYWTIRTPPGWSCLFVGPLNRANPDVTILSGVVDTDTYHSLIHFPFFMTGKDGLYTLEKGMPLVQVIPFRRDAASLPAEIRAEVRAETATRERVLRNVGASPGWYRLFSRAKR